MTKIINKTKGIIISDDCIICESILSKARGMMGLKKPLSLVFKFKKMAIVSLHMYFVKFPIDVMFIDFDNKVVEVKRDFRPGETYTPKNKAAYVVELSVGSLDGTEEGDEICGLT